MKADWNDALKFAQTNRTKHKTKKRLMTSALGVCMTFSTLVSHAEVGIGWSCDSKYTPHGFTVKWKEYDNKISLNTMCADWWGRSKKSRNIYNECLQCAKVQMTSMCKLSNDKTSKYCIARDNWMD